MTEAEFDKVVAEVRAAKAHTEFLGLTENPLYNQYAPEHTTEAYDHAEVVR